MGAQVVPPCDNSPGAIERPGTTIRRIGLDKPEFADPGSGKTPTAHGFRSSFAAWAERARRAVEMEREHPGVFEIGRD